jgi:hypothetical protein
VVARQINAAVYAFAFEQVVGGNVPPTSAAVAEDVRHWFQPEAVGFMLL